MKNNVYNVDQIIPTVEGDINNKVIYYSSKFNEYGIPIHDGENGRASSYILIEYCPWCGKELPESKRDEWFELLEELGFDCPFEDDIPQKFKTSEWYSKE
ncbi:MAG: hypothetical protein IJ447_05060 [Clostridia bacterium]|nr:hypothetical protein [Clostridia bacterium]